MWIVYCNEDYEEPTTLYGFREDKDEAIRLAAEKFQERTMFSSFFGEMIWRDTYVCEYDGNDRKCLCGVEDISFSPTMEESFASATKEEYEHFKKLSTSEIIERYLVER